MKTFNDLGLTAETLAVLRQKGFEIPTQIQEQAIPVILTTNKDVVGQAQTGTGKTAAFGLPIIESIKENAKEVQALVLTPTRELALQVTEELNSFRGKKNLSIVPIYGGQSIDLQFRSLKKGVDIVVGTPGRIIDHLQRGTLRLDRISYLVLDEADEMLNMGFLEDVQKIIEKTSVDKRVLLFSATMPPEIKKIAQKYMREHISIKVTTGQLTASQTDQIYFEVSESEKFETLCRIIDMEEGFYGLVFCRTKVDVDKISNHLAERGYDAEGLHGDLSQNSREKILNKFKKGVINILVATDVAARGIDVQNLTHVINYALPQDPEAYVHRIGRTGRAGKEGNAVTFITPSEYQKLQHIKRKVMSDIRKATLPSIKDMIAMRRQKVKAQLENMIKTGQRAEHATLIQELLAVSDAKDIIAALLEHSFGEELDEKKYTEIGSAAVDTKGKTRLFIKRGKNDGLTSGKLVTLLAEKCRLTSAKIKDIQILDNFSFVTLSFHDAEMVLDFFKKNEKGRWVVQKAKDKK